MLLSKVTFPKELSGFQVCNQEELKWHRAGKQVLEQNIEDINKVPRLIFYSTVVLKSAVY